MHDRSVIVINSLVARGAVGGRVSVAVLERLGFAVIFVPTVLLTWHPGQGPSDRSPNPGFDAMLADLAGSERLGEVAGVLSGYLGDAGQTAGIAQMVGAVRSANPQALYLCDPVIGDGGRPYVPEGVQRGIVRALAPIADIVTPNVHELAWLAGEPAVALEDQANVAARLPASEVLVTSSGGRHTDETGAVLVANGRQLVGRHELAETAVHGVGDLMAALYLGHRLRGLDGAAAMGEALTATRDMTFAAARRGLDDLPLASEGALLEPGTAPAVSVEPL